MFPKYVLLSICAFILVHFGYSGKFHSIHPSAVHTFFQKLAMISEFFFKEELEVISFRKHVGFSAKQLIFLFSLFFSFFYLFISFSCLFLFFFPFFFHEVFCYLNMCIFLLGIFAIYMHKVSCYLNIHIYIL